MDSLLLNLKPESTDVSEFYTTTHPRESSTLVDTGGDSGFDLFFPRDITIEPGETVLIDLGVSCEFLSNGSPCGFWLLARSSIYKTPLRFSGSVGLIDKGYRKNLKVAVDNIKSEPYTVKKGERLFQVVHGSLHSFNVRVLGEQQVLSHSDRGGHGSTGK